MVETPTRATADFEAPHDAGGAGDLVRAALDMIDEATILVSQGGAVNQAATQRRLALLRQAVAHVPVFVLAGEFNSGKSSLCNLISGIDALPTDFLATTSVPTHLYFADSPELAGFTHGNERRALEGTAAAEEPLARIAAGFPVEILRSFELIDTPGLADPDARHSEAVLARIHADAVIWCTPATQAWKESERHAWTKLAPRLRRSTILVLTFSDLAASAAELERVRTRLDREAGPFRAIVAVASRPGRQSGRGDLIAACRTLRESLMLRRVERTATLLQRILRTL